MGKVLHIPALGVSIGFIGLIPRIVQDRHGIGDHMVMVEGKAEMATNLSVVVRDKDGRVREVSEYFGKNENWLKRNFYKYIYRGQKILNLGSGLTTNVAALAIANEAVTLASPSGARINLLFLANNHATGTGSTGAAATDVSLQTADAVTPQAGAQTLVSAANVQKYQTVATLTGYGTEAVTEWALLTSTTLSSTTGTPLTNATGTTATVTGTPLTASSSTVQGKQQNIIVDTTASPKVYGLVISNTTSAATVPAWYKNTDGTAGATPGNTDAIAWWPIMLDHKVFSAINTVSGDTIQFTYQLTIASGN